MKYHKTTLKNGLRIITIPKKDAPSVTAMVLVETGSNYESKEQSGLSHFLEHMVFKGTKKRPKAIDISLELDSLGAESNAFTSNEMTGYWARAEKRHFKKIFEIVSDMYLNPTLPAEELERERGVILQEISMYEDLPQRKVWEVWDKLLHGDTPAGRVVIGPAENIKKFSRKDFLDYRNKHYVAGKTIIIISGPVTPKLVKTEAEKHFANISRNKKIGKPSVSSKQKVPGISLFHKETDQAHLILGFRTFGAKDKRRTTLNVLASILGQGMSSRLYQKLREDMGVCYYVRASADQYTDYGALTISTGVDSNRVEEVVSALLDEIRKIKKFPIPALELRKAKDFMVGNMFMGLETTDSLANLYAEQEIVDGKLRTPQELKRDIEKVTAKDIQKLANEIFRDDRANFAMVSKHKDSSRLKKLLMI